MIPPENQSSQDEQDEAWINDRMARLVASPETPEDIQKILLEGLTESEMRAFCLGVRAGKHASARILMDGLKTKMMETILEVDPYMK
jgi:hypothetical protein